MASAGAIERVAQGVYRMAGAPPQDHEAVYATWLGLGGATASRTETGVAPGTASTELCLTGPAGWGQGSRRSARGGGDLLACCVGESSEPWP
jgi:hypothetical protein